MLAVDSWCWLVRSSITCLIAHFRGANSHHLIMAASMATIPRQLFAMSSLLFAPFPSTIFGTSLSIPFLPSLRDLIPPFLLAAPKKKVSHSRKAMRSANKGLKDKQSEGMFHSVSLVLLNDCKDVVHCPGCGSAKLAHHLCPHCYSSINRAWKSGHGSPSVSEVPL